jgi:RNA polymerase sigma factor (sigma-70 family)
MSNTSPDFIDLYHAYKDRVYNLALNYVQNKEDAEEVTQDVFVAVHRGLSTFRGEAAAGTWIYRITINRCQDVIKARTRKKRFGFIVSLLGMDGNDIRPHFDHPGVLLEQRQATEQLFRYINELPDNQKTALLLAKTEQKSQVEIGEIMGISAKAAESLIQRAKANLTSKLKKNEGNK